jgi:regulator of cell morphogenesis and NO signaling
MENNIALENIISDLTIGEIVAQDFRKAEVFKKYGIDFCCRGNVTIEEACAKREINSDELIEKLLEIENKEIEPNTDFNSWDLSELADYIVNKHHKYVAESIPIMREFGTKVCKVHGEHNPELIDIYKHFNYVAEELLMHMPKEECMLFPYIKELNAANKTGAPINKPHFGSVQNPIRMMELEHITAGNDMEKAKELSNNFTPPDHACATYRVFFSKLNEFEIDLHHHIHLENNILFKKAIELEQKLFDK